MELKFRTLKADEIECRVGQCKENGCSLLLYQDSRCGMNLLDEVVGPMNWQREHNFKDGKLYCKVSIYDNEKNIWVSKEDVGVESNTEAEKGQSSDSFKRACVNWGIGRELYSSPFIWIKLDSSEVMTDKGKPRLNSSVSFSVAEIGYDANRNVNQLVIVDKEKKVRYSFGTSDDKKYDKPKKEVKPKQEPKPIEPQVAHTPQELDGGYTPTPPINLLTKFELDVIVKNPSLSAMMTDLLGGVKYSQADINTKNAIATTIRAEMRQRGIIL